MARVKAEGTGRKSNEFTQAALALGRAAKALRSVVAKIEAIESKKSRLIDQHMELTEKRDAAQKAFDALVK